MSNQDFYQSIRDRIESWAGTIEGKEFKWTSYVLLLPDFFHLLCALALDKRILAKDKAQIGIAIAYIVSPVDLIPEALVGPIGFADDVALAAYTLNRVLNNTDRNIIEEHWKGDRDLLETISHIVEVADQMIGKGLWEKVKGFGKG